ncbi:mdm2-binding protein-like [Mercenaria mercenaria]|uniref:mdm2-binding protein-like n=1 Tax=Mercenaria mercenaria TaxID=6596 RepID=UPI00234E6993|nr:mdm2-binding protein-like [Mercenaria mercenaria]
MTFLSTFSGIVVDVYLWPPKVSDKSDYILFLGALRRLKDWHNAHVVVFEPDPSPDTEFLQKFLSADVYVDIEGFHVKGDNLMWRGKVSVCDKIENKGLTVPGVSMHKIREETPDLQFPIIEQNRDGCCMGRMLEVLDEVALSSVPSLMKTPHTGMLARLAVYPEQEEQPSCGEVGLSTEAWKENIMADIQFVQEPEEDLQDNYEFLYFIITSPDEHQTLESFVAFAYLLQHPYHLNGELVNTMYSSSTNPVKGDNNTEVDLSDLPLMSWETLRNVEADIVSLQRTMLHKWAETKQGRNEGTEVQSEVLAAMLAEIRLKYFNKLKEKLKDCETFKDIPAKWRINVKKEIYDGTENTAEWPERLGLQYMESQKRSLSRVQSSESMPMSSPIQPSEVTTSIDIQSFLKFFQPDGSASNTNMSPVHRRHPCRTKSKLSTPDTASPHQPSWPESKDITSHDVYYNVDKKAEKVNKHLNKLQEKYVKEETYSSCLSPVCLFPRATKKQHVKQEMELRRSPRKKNPRSVFDENLPGFNSSLKNSGRLSDSHTPLGTLHDNESRRRFSTPQGLPLQNVRRLSSSLSKEFSSQRRSSDVGLSQVPVPKQLDKLRRQSDAGSSFTTPQGEGMKKESRSERHKRRLQEIVDRVLVDNGVCKTDPIYKSCSSRLFKVTKLFVMDLPNSRNLKDEMQKIAESQVKQVIEVDRSRQESTHKGKHKK